MGAAHHGRGRTTRRTVLKTGAAAGVTTGLLGGAGIAKAAPAPVDASPGDGDTDILKFLYAAEVVETDLWQQYTELAEGNAQYGNALRKIDASLIRYIGDDRDDELSHANLIKAYLESIGDTVPDLSGFATLDPVSAPGSDTGRKRVTNLRSLTVDTSFYTRYRGTGNPDFGDSFPQIATINDAPTIPTQSSYTNSAINAIAQSAALHFCTIESGGGQLYSSLLEKTTSINATRILAAIGPTEVYHFAGFHKSIEGLFGARSGSVVIPSLKADPQTARAIFPEPATFLSASFPKASVIRPTRNENAGAVAAATGLVTSGLFEGQSQAFLDAVVALATAADAATRDL